MENVAPEIIEIALRTGFSEYEIAKLAYKIAGGGLNHHAFSYLLSEYIHSIFGNLVKVHMDLTKSEKQTQDEVDILGNKAMDMIKICEMCRNYDTKQKILAEYLSICFNEKKVEDAVKQNVDGLKADGLKADEPASLNNNEVPKKGRGKGKATIKTSKSKTKVVDANVDVDADADATDVK